MLLSNEIDSPSTIIENFPLSFEHSNFLQNAIETNKNLLSGKDLRIPIIVGPCSIHDYTSAVEYANRLKELKSRVSNKIHLIMRVYIEKPRTRLGWKGLLYDPYLDGTSDICSGINICRKLLLELAEMEIPTATEFLSPIALTYFKDLISWS